MTMIDTQSGECLCCFQHWKLDFPKERVVPHHVSLKLIIHLYSCWVWYVSCSIIRTMHIRTTHRPRGHKNYLAYSTVRHRHAMLSWEVTWCRLCKLELHASIDDSNVIVSAVGLLELLHILQLGSEGHQNSDQHFMGSHVHFAIAQEEVPSIDLYARYCQSITYRLNWLHFALIRRHVMQPVFENGNSWRHRTPAL